MSSKDGKKAKSDNSFVDNKNGIEVDKKDPIYDVMTENEINEASARLESLLEEDNEEKS